MMKCPVGDGTHHPARFREGLRGVNRAPPRQKPPAEAGGMTLPITHDADTPPRQKPPAEAGGMTLPITHDAVGQMPGIETPGK